MSAGIGLAVNRDAPAIPRRKRVGESILNARDAGNSENMQRFAEFFRLLLAVTIASLAASSGIAQERSAKHITLLVGFGAGGTTDLAARAIAEPISHMLGRPVIVENKAGATGGIAAADLKRATPDGDTLMVAPSAVAVLAPLVSRNLDYDPVRDFAPVAQILRFQLAFAVRADHPARSLGEYIAWARSHPKQASFGTSGAGSFPHLFGVSIGKDAGVEMVHIAYKGFPSLAKDLLGGQIPAAIDTVSDLIELHRAGRIRILATSGTARSSLCADVPTFAEEGFPSLTAVSWIAVYAPANTPGAVIDQLSTAVRAAVQTVEVRARLMNMGYEPTGTTAGELKDIMAADTDRWAPVVKATGFRGD